ncbi:VOC family protein [Agaribacterium sp. ZY112]|uniref:VOC family protein n=1 Tax=Agaribacterium sp. ZY112 TaxID=3233574 RepID=UPI003523A3DA
MIGYVTIGTNQFIDALTFYDELLKLVGAKRLWSTDSMAAWGLSRELPALCISKPFNGEPAAVGNGSMIALKVESKEQVSLLHAKALELGGTCEGKPGPRGSGGFYGAYFRDLDGNKLNAYLPASSP